MVLQQLMIGAALCKYDEWLRRIIRPFIAFELSPTKGGIDKGFLYYHTGYETFFLFCYVINYLQKPRFFAVFSRVLHSVIRGKAIRKDCKGRMIFKNRHITEAPRKSIGLTKAGTTQISVYPGLRAERREFRTVD